MFEVGGSRCKMEVKVARPMQGLNTCRVFIASFRVVLLDMAHGRMKTGVIFFPFIAPEIAQINLSAN